MNFISKFNKGKWKGKAAQLVGNPQKLKALLSSLGTYLSRKGLQEIKENLLLMRSYVCDVLTGKYKDYDAKKLTLIVAAIIYVVTPFDFLPDFIPGGLIDDVSIATWAMKEAWEELKKYKSS